MRRREGERRTAPARDWDVEKSRKRSRSRSPIKSKLMAMAMSDRKESHKSKSDTRKQDNDRKRTLRMDELNDRKNVGGKTRRRSRSRQRPRTSLDKAVQMAREERSNYWDKKILEAEEKDPDRWGHSGFKELYRKDLKKKRNTSKGRRSRSSSVSLRRRQESRSLVRRRKSLSRSYSRSRSPSRTIKSKRRRSISRSRTPVRSSKKSTLVSPRGSRNREKAKSSLNVRPVNRSDKLKKTSGSKDLIRRKGRSISPSSESSSSSYDSKRKPPLIRQGKHKLSGASNKRLLRDSESSSGSSSDEDVLQLHPKRRGRSSSFSYSGSSSSSRSASSVRKPNSSSSSSSSSSESSSDSDSDISIRAKPAVPLKTAKVESNSNKAIAGKGAKAKPKLVKPSTPTQPKSDAKPTTVQNKTVAKTTLTTSNNNANSKKLDESNKAKDGLTESKNTPKKRTGQKSPSESGETETDSDSSESDSEPRMTLSERFAKLAQMSTDKREMAKPILSVNEIDTKMRVVKDLRNVDAPKVYIPGGSNSDKMKTYSRPPPNYPGATDRDSDDRRRYFEKMYRDVPAERPLDWSDARVRYNYYKSRGCFDERPITFDEYLKWEDWYLKYREWLETEGYYRDRAAEASSRTWNHGSPNGNFSRETYRSYNMGRREAYGPHHSVPLSSRPDFRRAEGNAYLQPPPMGRRIDRAPGGSLVVNVRQGEGLSDFDARRRIGMGRLR